MPERTHTPLPWIAGGDEVRGPEDCLIADCNQYDMSWRDYDDPNRKRAELEANAAFIVLACNSHYELVGACKAAARLYAPEGKELYDHFIKVRNILETALAAAGEKP